MSTQAPSPTSAEADGGQGAVVDEQVVPKTEGGAAQEGVGEEGAPGEVAPPKPRQRKEKLPGVVSRDDGDDIFPDLGFKSNRKPGKRISREEATRELEEEMRGEGMDNILDLPEPPPGAKPEEEAPKVEKVKFADKEYDSLEAAEQSFKSLQGMFKPLQERVSKAEELAQKAAESARAWRERAMQLEQGMAVPSPTPQQPTPQAPRQDVADDTKAQLDEALSNVNGELFESLAREHGLPLAGRYLAAQVLATVHDKMLPALRKEIMDQIQPELEPLKQDRGFQQATQHVAGLIETVGEYKNTDGTDAFPELRDPQQVYEIGDLWRSMDLPAEIALTPKGLLQAVALYRMYKSTGGGQTTTSTPQVEVSRPTTTAPSPVIQALEAGQAIAPGRVRGDSDGQRFARELESAPLVDPVLGFSIRRRR